MAGPSERTGNYPAASGRLSPPPAPPAGTPGRDAWVAQEVRIARRDSMSALEAVERIEKSIGFSPDPAKGIKEGTGIAGQLSTIIDQNTRKEQNSAARRYIMIGVSIALGIIMAALGIIKALAELVRH